MLPTTLDAVRGILRTDQSLTSQDRARLMALWKPAPKQIDQNAPPVQTGPLRILRRREAAARLGVSLRTIDLLATQKVIQKIKFPGRKRACGFRESDIAQLITGGSHEAS